MTISVRIAAKTVNTLGEAAIWDHGLNKVLWLDLIERKFFQLDPVTGEVSQSIVDVPGQLASVLLAKEKGAHLLLHQGGLSGFDIRTAMVGEALNPEASREGTSFNDGKVARDGTVWMGSLDLAEQEPRAALWSTADGKTARFGDAGFVCSNGPAFSPDGKKLYFSDSYARRIVSYDVDKQSLANRSTLINLPDGSGYPDGLTVDVAGNIWIAHFDGGRVSCWDADGTHLRDILLPCPHATSVAFGGNEMSTLFITTATYGLSNEDKVRFNEAGALLACEPGVQGIPEPRSRF